MNAARTVPCPACQGTGTLRTFLADNIPDNEPNIDADATVDVDCNLCRGTGRRPVVCGRPHPDDPSRTCDKIAGHTTLQCEDRRGVFPVGHRLGGAA